MSNPCPFLFEEMKCRADCESDTRFLLKYASRDEVELLGSGSGGVVELRHAVEGYQEASPLYGFLRYRRRNVLIKYLPEGCSRLIQGESNLEAEIRLILGINALT